MLKNIFLFLLCCSFNQHIFAEPVHQYKTAYVSPENYSPDKLKASILHILYTGESLEDSLQTFANPKESVSVHYLIAENGDIYSLVPETNCAWHAGQSSWGSLYAINRHAIGIALVNKGITDKDAKTLGWSARFPAYPQAQIEALSLLCHDIIKRNNIKPWNIVGHSDIAPQRKYDPGLQFPWEELAKKGVGLWPDLKKSTTETINTVDFLKKLGLYGYSIPERKFNQDNSVYDEEIKNVIAAFQAHFRPSKPDGILDSETNAILTYLIQQKTM